MLFLSNREVASLNGYVYRIKMEAVLIASRAKDINKIEIINDLYLLPNVLLVISVILFSAHSAFRRSIKFKEMRLKVIK